MSNGSVVVQPNGKLAVFSSIVDDFVLQDADESDVIAYFVAIDLETRIRNAREAIERGRREPERFEDALAVIGTIHGAKHAARRRKDSR